MLKTLIEEQNNSKKAFEQRLKAIENIPQTDNPPKYSNPPDLNREIALQVSSGSFAITSSNFPGRKLPDEKADEQPLWPSRLAHRKEEIEHHCHLIRDLLKQISDVQYKIDHGLRDRMHRGVLGIHWEEWSPLRGVYGDETLMRVFARHSEVVS